MKKSSIVAIVLATGLFFSGGAFAYDVVWCTGKITSIFVYKNGDVYVRPTFAGDYLRVCNLNYDLNTVTPEVCTEWHKDAVTAYLTDREVVMQYPVSTVSQCDTIPTYANSPEPNYFLLR